MTGSYAALDRIRAAERQQSEAVARPARVRFFANVHGIGESRLEGRRGIVFGSIMAEEPSFTFGVVAQSQIQQDCAPQATATVLRWKTQGKFWIGADLVFMVDAVDPNIRLKFSLTFEGVTLRTTAPIRTNIR